MYTETTNRLRALLPRPSELANQPGEVYLPILSTTGTDHTIPQTGEVQKLKGAGCKLQAEGSEWRGGLDAAQARRPTVGSPRGFFIAHVSCRELN